MNLGFYIEKFSLISGQGRLLFRKALLFFLVEYMHWGTLVKQYVSEVTDCLNSVDIRSIEDTIDTMLETSHKKSSIK